MSEKFYLFKTKAFNIFLFVIPFLLLTLELITEETGFFGEKEVITYTSVLSFYIFYNVVFFIYDIITRKIANIKYNKLILFLIISRTILLYPFILNILSINNNLEQLNLFQTTLFFMDYYIQIINVYFLIILTIMFFSLFYEYEYKIKEIQKQNKKDKIKKKQVKKEKKEKKEISIF